VLRGYAKVRVLGKAKAPLERHEKMQLLGYPRKCCGRKLPGQIFLDLLFRFPILAFGMALATNASALATNRAFVPIEAGVITSVVTVDMGN